MSAIKQPPEAIALASMTINKPMGLSNPAANHVASADCLLLKEEI